LLTARGGRPHWDVPFELGDRLVFGKESSGVGPAFHAAWVERHGPDRVVSLPMAMVPGVRSLNLATAVAIVVYEGLRHLRSQGRLDPRIGVPAPDPLLERGGGIP
jgi:tRNA (cytidine/uridine-2'-O-)-methyltransferase